MYDALYQARSTAINGTSLDVFIPQIFGDVPVKVTRFIGSIPTVIGMGWVLFQGGDSAYPVWMGLDFSNDRSFITTGIPAGGIDGQVLTKQSDANYAAAWETLPAINTGVLTVIPGVNVTIDSSDPAHPVVIGAYQIPAGGTTDQVLAKNSNSDRDLKWFTLPSSYLPLAGGTLTGGLSGTTASLSGALSSASLATGGASFSGGLTFSGGGEIVHSNVTGAYMRWFSAPGASIGYLQGNAGMLLNSDGGVLGLAGNGGINFSGGRMDFASQALQSVGSINGYTPSTGVIVNRVVLADSSGHIYGSYINMTANVAGGWPSYVAGQSGDNFMRWYNRIGLFQHDGPGTTGIWSTYQMVIHDSNLGNGQVGLAGWCNANTWAPIWRVNPTNGVGERWDAVNNGNNAYARIAAIAYDTISTERSKTDVAVLDDDDLLARLERTQAKRWMPKVGPQQVRPTDRFRALNQRWQARGRTGLVMQAQHTDGSEDHDCAAHDCDGHAGSPCAIARNFATGAMGLVAEDHFDAFPEHVNVDVEGIPHSIDTSQVAATALGGLGALVRYVRSLEARLAALEPTHGGTP